MSQSWSLPIGGWSWCPGDPRTGVCLLVVKAVPEDSAGPMVGRAFSSGLWLQGPEGTRASTGILVGKTQSWVGRAGSQSGCGLRGFLRLLGLLTGGAVSLPS